MDRAATTELVFGHLERDDEARRESLLGLGNGVLFARACAPEAALAAPGDEARYAGLYLAGTYNHAQREIDDEPVGITSLVNLPDPFGLSFRWLDDDRWFGLDHGRLLHYRHRLDMAAGIARREATLHDAAGRETALVETRFVSQADAELALLRWTVTPLNWSAPVLLCARQALQARNAKLARTRAYEGRHLDVQALPPGQAGEVGVQARTTDGRHRVELHAWLCCEAADRIERIEQDEALLQQCRIEAEAGRSFTADLWVRVAPAQAPRTTPAVEDYGHALAAHQAAWQALWQRVPIAAPGDPELERACRLHAFHLLQTASPLSATRDAGFPARGWQEGYFGHVFWDEVFAFPFYSLRLPEVARELIAYRHRRLEPAREAAQRAGCRGAMFPWRSAESGAEETPRYQWIPPARHWKPDHTRLQHHIGCAIAYNLWQHHLATGDRALLCGIGGDLLVEIARFWASRVQAGGDGRLAIRGVVGPDEYHDAYPDTAEPGLDNNAYTNVMAAWTLCCATQLQQHLRPTDWQVLSARLQLAPDEPAQWREVARRITLPLLDGDVIAQFDGYDRLLPMAAMPRPPDGSKPREDWWLDARGDSVNRYQVTKQADVLMLFYLLGPDTLQSLFDEMGYRLAPGWYERTVQHYLARISHESSLSRITCAGALAAVDVDASWRYYRQALQTDLAPSSGGSTHEGLHLGAMAGSWDVLQRWYLGLSLQADGLVLRPRPPSALDDVAIGVRVRGLALQLRLQGRCLHISAADGPAEGLALQHEGEVRRLRPGQAVQLRCR